MTTKKQVVTFLEQKRDFRISEIRKELNEIYSKRMNENRNEVTSHLKKIISLQNEILDLNDSSSKFKSHYTSWHPMYRYINYNGTWETYNSNTGHFEITENGIENYLFEKAQWNDTKDGSQALYKKLNSVKDEWNNLIRQLKQFSSAKEMIEVLKANGIKYEEPNKIENNLPAVLVIDKEKL